MTYVITRQHQFPEGDLVVEISQGGIDYTNPDAFVKKYRGEFDEIQDPREAVETAIKIAQQWQADQPEDKILIAMGCTHGNTIPFEGRKLTKGTFKELRAKAKAIYDTLPKCVQCGELLGKDKYGNSSIGEYDCCSEYCAEKYYAPDEEELNEI